jgi:hypothetical protein
VVLFLAASKKEQWKTKEASSIVSTTGYHSGEGATVTIVGIFYHLFLQFSFLSPNCIPFFYMLIHPFDFLLQVFNPSSKRNHLIPIS